MAKKPIYEELEQRVKELEEEAEKRKRAEEALRKSETNVRSILSAAPIGIGKVHNRVIDWVSDRFVEMLGYDRDELIGKSAKIVYEDDEEYDRVGRVKYGQISEGGIGEVDTRLRRKDGSILDVHLRSAPVDPNDLSAGVIFTALDITELKRAEEALRRLNEELLKEHNQRRILSKSLIDLLEKDRRQIAMELHDHIGQTLTSLKMNLEMIHGKLKPGHTELGAQIKVAQEKTVQAIKDVKNVSHGLRPAMIDALGVVSSLRGLCNEVQQQTDMEIHFFSRGLPKRLKGEMELAIYRIAQEGLTNIIRHAQAKNVFVNLVKKDKKLSLSVEDDGVGFDQDKVMKPSKRKGPLGLLIMRERAAQLDGEFTLESQIGKGTHLLVEIPI